MYRGVWIGLGGLGWKLGIRYGGTGAAGMATQESRKLGGWVRCGFLALGVVAGLPRQVFFCGYWQL